MLDAVALSGYGATMSLPSFDLLFTQADAVRSPVGVAAAGGADRTVLQALRTACDRGWITPFVAGRDKDIVVCSRANRDIHEVCSAVVLWVARP